MALRITFEPGPQQSVEASRYFTEVSSDIMSSSLPVVEPRHLLFMEKGQAPLPLRVWSSHNSIQDGISSFVPWLREVAEGMRTLGRQSDIGGAMELARTWLKARHMEGDLFVEMLNPAHAFTEDENNELSVGIVSGETVMLSARNVMFAKLSPGIFGLTVAGMGSWLIEQFEGKEPVQRFSPAA